jgi:argininosuccinate lyase
MRAVEPRITKAVFAVLGPENAVRLRTSPGGTAPKLVRRAAVQARKRYL